MKRVSIKKHGREKTARHEYLQRIRGVFIARWKYPAFTLFVSNRLSQRTKKKRKREEKRGRERERKRKSG